MTARLPQTTNPAEAGSEGMFDILPPLNEYGAAVRSGIRVARDRKKPREIFGVVTRGTRSKSCHGIPDASPLPGAATAKGLSGLFSFRAAVKAHVVMGSQGARTPEQPELLAALYSRGDQNRVSGHVGFESACPGWQPMRTVAQQPGNQISQQRRHGVSPKAVIRRALPRERSPH